jgi:dephospho-CoA kinase
MSITAAQNIEKKGQFMKPFGLTGNIGCGKSTVSKLLGKHVDVLILDCDRIAREIVSCDKYRRQINAILGTNVLLGEKSDSRTIAKIIFEEPKKKKLLEALIHPLVWAIVNEGVVSAGDSKICVVESAIIFETNNENKFAAIIVATCESHEQFRRLRENRWMKDVEIQARLDQQLPLFEKEKRAQFVIHTDCSLKQLKDRVSSLYQNLKQMEGNQL